MYKLFAFVYIYKFHNPNNYFKNYDQLQNNLINIAYLAKLYSVEYILNIQQT